MDAYPGLSGCEEGKVIIRVLGIGVSESEENKMVEAGFRVPWPRAVECRPLLEIGETARFSPTVLRGKFSEALLTHFRLLSSRTLR